MEGKHQIPTQISNFASYGKGHLYKNQVLQETIINLNKGNPKNFIDVAKSIAKERQTTTDVQESYITTESVISNLRHINKLN